MHSGGGLLGQGAAVLEEVDFLPVKVFLVPVQAYQEMEYGEEFVEALPQEPEWLPRAFSRHLAQGDAGSHGRVLHHHHRQNHRDYFPVDWLMVWELPFPEGSLEVRTYFLGSEGNDAHQRWCVQL